MNIDELTIGQVRQLKNMLGSQSESITNDDHWVINCAYLIRTVAFTYTGRLVRVTDKEIILTDAAWIPDTGRFTQFVEKGNLNEVEPYPDGILVILNRSAIVDACLWRFDLPREQK